MIKETLKIMPISSSTNDTVLINNILNGNQVNDSYLIIYKKYFNEIKLFLLSKSQGQVYLHASFDDIIQESFIDLYENIVNNRYEHRGMLKAYVQRIAWNRFLKEVRNKNAPYDQENNNKEDRIDIDSGYDSLDSIYLRAAEIAFKRLNDELCKDIILLKFYNGLSDKEIFDINPILKNVDNVKRRRNSPPFFPLPPLCFNKLRKLCADILTQETQSNY